MGIYYCKISRGQGCGGIFESALELQEPVKHALSLRLPVQAMDEFALA